MIEEVADDVREGRALSEALAKHQAGSCVVVVPEAATTVVKERFICQD